MNYKAMLLLPFAILHAVAAPLGSKELARDLRPDAEYNLRSSLSNTPVIVKSRDWALTPEDFAHLQFAAAGIHNGIHVTRSERQ
ncbi:hypothetical protein QCA50_016137 [Cerrena zonata]|uniref:Uncharacterized protein n=1 Tax=Cerrena zonata TaxID=2478898 RepID=A0AAW0FKY8_9APHY